MRWCARAALCVGLFVFSIAASAESIVDVSGDFVDVLPKAWMLEDKTQNLTAADVVSEFASRAELKQSTANFGFSDAAHWFGVLLHNPQPHVLRRLLVVDPTWLDKVSIYYQSPLGKLIQIHGGDTLPFSSRAISHHKINFQLDIPSGTSRLIIRTQTVDPYVVNLELWEPGAFHAADADQRLYIGVVYGAIAALLLYNLVLFFSVRESVYAAYSGYLFSFLVMHSTYNGYTYALLWPDSPVWGNWAHAIFIYIFVFSGLYFCTQFLQLREKMPQGFRAVKIIAVLAVLSFLLTPMVGGYSLQVQTSIIWVVLYTPTALVLGWISLFQGNAAARYFLTAALAGFIGSFVTALTVLGFIPFTFFTYHAVDFGMLVDAVLLSLALADRLRIARVEAESAKNKLLETTSRYAEDLEQQVQLRTIELKQANATKDKFLSIVGHDLKGPIGGLNTLFSTLVISSKDMTDDTLETVRTTVRTTSDFLDQLFMWARTQRGDLRCQPQWFDVTEIVTEVFGFLGSQAAAKGITLTRDGVLSANVYADRKMISLVIRNLLGNAIKYSFAGGDICVTINEQEDHWRIQVKDSGVGISPAVQQSLFRADTKPVSLPGTENEVGTGLGLILCSEFVHMNGGQIGVESAPTEGTLFWFTVPKLSSGR
ncbi:MAG: sensor histidine kinase [Gammaproteobacteria bacterium]|nr:sensor histidine kinase [Gammaproteobacteria bacterium]